MQKLWEEVLGQWVLFVELEGGRWQWRCRDMDVQQDPAVRYHSVMAARLSCAAMIYCFFVMEETTSELSVSGVRFGYESGQWTNSRPPPPPEGAGGG